MIKSTLAALAVVFAVPATAQQCAPRDDMIAALARVYGEVRVSQALDHNNFLIEVFANPVSGSWTAVLTTPDMQACIAAAGTEYEYIGEAPGVDG